MALVFIAPAMPSDLSSLPLGGMLIAAPHTRATPHEPTLYISVCYTPNKLPIRKTSSSTVPKRYTPHCLQCCSAQLFTDCSVHKAKPPNKPHEHAS